MLADREVVFIDIAKDCSDYQDLEKDPRRFKSVKTGRGPLTGKWYETCEPVMCCYKLVSVEFKWWGLQSRVESFIHKQEQRLFTIFHRELFCWTDQWYGLTMADIRTIEDETKTTLDKGFHLKMESSLDECDWQPVTYLHTGGYWFAKLDVEHEVVKVMFTDLKQLWLETVELDAFCERLKESNSNLEGDAEPLVQLCKSMLQQKTDCAVDVETFEDSSLIAKFHGKFADVPFRWSTHVAVANSALFYAEIVEPLLLSVLQYDRREKKLFEVLEQKDMMLKDALKISSPVTADSSVFSSERWTQKDLESADFSSLEDDFFEGKAKLFDPLLFRLMISRAKLKSSQLLGTHLIMVILTFGRQRVYDNCGAIVALMYISGELYDED
ncbi:unnamed protein product [Soboliphyme baturini]|uniref:XLF domain-containing protein n=1 Tax=Soboliphyme baturini TaxID=241478 RepID=A0A183IRE1_9BILA|nr:unnamed protein product [Soboliphyme baturini]